ncbi:hypothetical protein MTO96_024803, partial [Rhipicephalus appendiculatus]
RGRSSTWGDTPIPEKFQQTLRLGPRFSLEPFLRGAEKVALARNVSSRVPEDERVGAPQNASTSSSETRP